ncbi:hypothetical protein D3C83_120200 [compost metagenome]
MPLRNVFVTFEDQQRFCFRACDCQHGVQARMLLTVLLTPPRLADGFGNIFKPFTGDGCGGENRNAEIS